MTDAQRIDALEAALADVLKRLDPQTLAQALERTWSPRGGEPRIVDSSGRTLDYAPAVQFLNATTALDAPNQRVVVTASGGGSVALEFSDDATIGPAERLRFASQSGPTSSHYDVSTASFGTSRNVVGVVAEDAASPSGAFSADFLTADGTALTADRSLVASGDVSATVAATASSDAAAGASVSATDSGGVSTATLSLQRAASGGESAVLASASSDTDASVSLQTEASTTAAATVSASGQAGSGVAPESVLEATSPDEAALATVRAIAGASSAGLATVEAEGGDGLTASVVRATQGANVARLQVSPNSATGGISLTNQTESRTLLLSSGASQYVQALPGVSASHIYVGSVYDTAVSGLALPATITLTGARQQAGIKWVAVGRAEGATALDVVTIAFAPSGTIDIDMLLDQAGGSASFGGTLHVFVLLQS